MMELTQEQARKYLAGDRQGCPYCGSDNIEGDCMDHDGTSPSQRLECLQCGGRWRDWYGVDAVSAAETGEVFSAPDWRAIADRLAEALEALMRHCVTPTGVPDKNRGRTAEQHGALSATGAALDAYRKAAGERTANDGTA